MNLQQLAAVLDTLDALRMLQLDLADGYLGPDVERAIERLEGLFVHCDDDACEPFLDQFRRCRGCGFDHAMAPGCEVCGGRVACRHGCEMIYV